MLQQENFVMMLGIDSYANKEVHYNVKSIHMVEVECGKVLDYSFHIFHHGFDALVEAYYMVALMFRIWINIWESHSMSRWTNTP